MSKPKKHIILMYISEVSGHHSATLAIEKAIKNLDPDASVLNINTFNYTNPVSEKFVNRLYMGVIKKTPKIWDYLYDNPNVKQRIERFKNMVHRMNSPKLKVLFERYEPGVIACTQAFPCGMVADFKKTYRSDLSLVAVLTDYISHSYWIHDQVNYYIAPSEEIKTELIRKNIPQNKIKILGIPFDISFNQPVDNDTVLEKIMLNANSPIILIMGGGQGLGPINKIIKSLDKIKTDFQEIIVTGTNRKLYNSIKRKLKKYKKRIALFEYANNIAELMEVSRLIITKPGGITTAEAMAKNLPIVIVHPIPGQEESNTLYFTQKGTAIRINDPHKVGAVIEDLLLCPAKLTRMSENAKKISKPNSTLEIAKMLLDLCNHADR